MLILYMITHRETDTTVLNVAMSPNNEHDQIHLNVVTVLKKKIQLALKEDLLEQTHYREQAVAYPQPQF